MLAALAGLGPSEIIVIAVVVLVIFGAAKVPQFMRGLGQGVKEFKDAIKDDPEAQAATRKPDEQSS